MKYWKALGVLIGGSILASFFFGHSVFGFVVAITITIATIYWTAKLMEFDASKHLDDLDIALVLLQNIGTLFQRLNKKQRNTLLQLVVKRFIINREGEIISHVLLSPFSYLSSLVTRKNGKNKEGWCSESIHEGVQPKPPNTIERFSLLRLRIRSLCG